MKHKFKNIDEVKVLQSFIENCLLKLDIDRTKQLESLLAAILKDLYATKVMPLLIKQEAGSHKVKFTQIQAICLDILLGQYDLTDLDNHHAAITLSSIAGDIDKYLVNNIKNYKQCETLLISGTNESKIFIKS